MTSRLLARLERLEQAIKPAGRIFCLVIDERLCLLTSGLPQPSVPTP